MPYPARRPAPLTRSALLAITSLFIATSPIIATRIAHSEASNVKLICHRYLSYENAASMESPPWVSVNDNVMGGRSQGSFIVKDSALRFFGSINTNGGGFASIRHDVDASIFTKADRVRLMVRSDGRPYSLNMRDKTSTGRRLAYRAPIKSKASTRFEPVEVLFSDLRPSFRGRPVQANPFQASEAASLSIMLSDNVDGPFELDLQWIEVCGG